MRGLKKQGLEAACHSCSKARYGIDANGAEAALQPSTCIISSNTVITGGCLLFYFPELFLQTPIMFVRWCPLQPQVERSSRSWHRWRSVLWERKSEREYKLSHPYMSIMHFCRAPVSVVKSLKVILRDLRESWRTFKSRQCTALTYLHLFKSVHYHSKYVLTFTKWTTMGSKSEQKMYINEAHGSLCLHKQPVLQMKLRLTPAEIFVNKASFIHVTFSQDFLACDMQINPGHH